MARTRGRGRGREANLNDVYERDEIARLTQQVEALMRENAELRNQHQHNPSPQPSVDDEFSDVEGEYFQNPFGETHRQRRGYFRGDRENSSAHRWKSGYHQIRIRKGDESSFIIT
ncbi:hypothetical protein ACP275_02G091900 [Erythranthe tilingii]